MHPQVERDSVNWIPVTWVGTVGVTVIGGVIGATAWATSVDSKLTTASSALQRIADEIEQRPTAAEINLQWQTLGKLNPELKLPPLLHRE
jgi:hypothetical protein